ncbi:MULTISPECIES: hypothetical protein [Luteimonas]|uniref:PglD-related sugar-binding protein n=1 Tax=Luteimonas TaxID=83614 RepID=UPI00117F755F|nr:MULTISPECIES: hypothetical protein [Luteimonas]
MKPLLVIGASSFGRLIRLLARDAGYDCLGFLDDFNEGEAIVGTRHALGTRFKPENVCLALAIGYRHLDARIQLYRDATSLGFSFPPLVHPRAIVSAEATIGDGSFLMAGCNVDAFAKLGAACVLWPGAIVSHDTTVGENTFVSPNATICGFAHVGHSSFIGAGSVIVDGASLDAHAFVKAGTRIGRRAANDR